MLDPEKLGHRYATFAAVTEELRKRGRPVRIVETGCLREVDNWAGDGQSTRIFDWLTGETGGEVISIDVDAAAIATAKSVVSGRVTFAREDGVSGVWRVGQQIDLLYIDSLDASSEQHHLMELTAAMWSLGRDSIVLVDDTRRPHGKWIGKGALIAAFMERVGTPIFAEGETQVAWMF